MRKSMKQKTKYLFGKSRTSRFSGEFPRLKVGHPSTFLMRSKYMGKAAIIFSVMVFVFSVIFLSNAISAQDKTQDDTAKRKLHQDANASEEYEAINGVAESFEQDEKKGIIVFIGNVKINRENGYLNADKVTVYKDVETDDVIKTVAEGNVDMKDGDLLATCEHAVLNESDDTIELTGSVVVNQKDDRVEAPYIIYNRTTGIRKGKGNETEVVRFRVRLKKKKKAESESTEATAEKKGENKD